MSGPLHRVVQDLDDLVGQIEAWACPEHDSRIEAEQPVEHRLLHDPLRIHEGGLRLLRKGLGLRCRGRRAV